MRQWVTNSPFVNVYATRKGATQMRNCRRMHSLARVVALSMLSTLAPTSGCVSRSPPPDADRLALGRVQRTVENQLTLGLEDELYVTAKLLPDTTITAAELERVYRDFFFVPNGRRRDTEYVYLNVYDARGLFLFQLAYDPRAGRMIRSRTEHY
jgi:hypothetical protein